VNLKSKNDKDAPPLKNPVFLQKLNLTHTENVLPVPLKKEINDLPQFDLNLIQVELNEISEHEALNFKNLIPSYEDPPYYLLNAADHFE